MGGGVLAQLALVVAGPHDLALVHDDGADRDVAVLERALGLAEGQPHEPLVAREEAGGRGHARTLCPFDGLDARLLATGAVVTAGDCRPSLPNATSDTDPAQLTAGRAHRDGERPRRPRHRPGRRALSRPPDPCVHYADAAAARRALPGLRRRAGVIGGPAALHRRASPTSTTRARPGPRGTAGGWQAVEWDLTGPFGINAPGAWTAAAALGARGGAGRQGRGGRHRRRLLQPASLPPLARPARRAHASRLRLRLPRRRSPTIAAATARSSPAPIAAAADNHFGMVGVAYGADIMPVRVLDSLGEGSSGAIASRRPLRRRPRRAGGQPLDRVLRPAERPAVLDHELARRARRDPLRRRASRRRSSSRPATPARPRSPPACSTTRSSTSGRRPSTAASPTTRTSATASTSSRPGGGARRVAAQRPQLRARRAPPGATSQQVSFPRAATATSGSRTTRGADRAEGHLDGRPARDRRRRAAARRKVLGPHPTPAADRRGA